jgi:hypothetical protein
MSAPFDRCFTVAQDVTAPEGGLCPPDRQKRCRYEIMMLGSVSSWLAGQSLNACCNHAAHAGWRLRRQSLSL